MVRGECEWLEGCRSKALTVIIPGEDAERDERFRVCRDHFRDWNKRRHHRDENG